MDDDLKRILVAVRIDQMLLRVIATEFVVQNAAQTSNPGEAVRELCNRMHRLVDDYDLPDSGGEEMEMAREAVRMNIDSIGAVAADRL